MSKERSEKEESILLPNVSAAAGVLGLLLSCGADASWEADELTGILTSGLAGLVIGILCVVNQRTGRTQAVAGIITGAISLAVFGSRAR